MGQAARTLLLIVSGHDPSGAGIDADLDAAKGTGVEPIAVVTARTDQDASRVRSIGARTPEEWGSEAARAAVAGLSGVKFGLLPGAGHVRRARELVDEMRRACRPSGMDRRGAASLPVVVDPVISASCGSRFLDQQAVETLRGELVAGFVVLTPNLPEAAELACLPRADLESSFAARLEAARILLALGAAGVVVKGGHGREDPVRDLVANADGTHRWIERPRRAGAGIRGSGCRFATRLAVGLALGRDLPDAAREAGEFVAAEIERAAGASGTS